MTWGQTYTSARADERNPLGSLSFTHTRKAFLYYLFPYLVMLTKEFPYTGEQNTIVFLCQFTLWKRSLSSRREFFCRDG